MRRAERAIYTRILEHGPAGQELEALYREVEEDGGYPRRVAEIAVRRLARQKVIPAPAGSRVALRAGEIPGTRPMTVEVERVGRGSASVLVNGSREASLEYDYEGPRQPAKKGAVKALRALRGSDRPFSLRVRGVLESV